MMKKLILGGAVLGFNILQPCVIGGRGRSSRSDGSLTELPIGMEIEYVEDRGGALTFKDVLDSRTDMRWVRSDKQNLGFGFTRSAYWLRFTVENVTGEDIQLSSRAGVPAYG